MARKWRIRHKLMLGMGLVVTFVGIFFRGAGYTFVLPYIDSPGLHFNL